MEYFPDSWAQLSGVPPGILGVTEIGSVRLGKITKITNSTQLLLREGTVTGWGGRKKHC